MGVNYPSFKYFCIQSNIFSGCCKISHQLFTSFYISFINSYSIKLIYKTRYSDSQDIVILISYFSNTRNKKTQFNTLEHRRHSKLSTTSTNPRIGIQTQNSQNLYNPYQNQIDSTNPLMSLPTLAEFQSLKLFPGKFPRKKKQRTEQRKDESNNLYLK